MKLVKNFVFTVLLVSALAVNTFAGDIELPGNKPGSQPPRLVAEEEPIPVTSTDTQTGAEADNLLYEALAALLSLY